MKKLAIVGVILIGGGIFAGCTLEENKQASNSKTQQEVTSNSNDIKNINHTDSQKAKRDTTNVKNSSNLSDNNKSLKNNDSLNSSHNDKGLKNNDSSNSSHNDKGLKNNDSSNLSYNNKGLKNNDSSNLSHNDKHLNNNNIKQNNENKNSEVKNNIINKSDVENSNHKSPQVNKLQIQQNNSSKSSTKVENNKYSDVSHQSVDKYIIKDNSEASNLVRKYYQNKYPSINQSNWSTDVIENQTIDGKIGYLVRLYNYMNSHSNNIAWILVEQNGDMYSTQAGSGPLVKLN